MKSHLLDYFELFIRVKNNHASNDWVFPNGVSLIN